MVSENALLMAHSARITYGQARYEVNKVLGRGPYSSVYEAYDVEEDQLVALKVLGLTEHDRDIAEAMFAKEVDALNGFNSEGVVKLLNHFVDRKSGAFCIVLELVRKAVNLEEFIVRETSDSETVSMPWRLAQMKQLIGVLDQAHTRRVFHRDVKPANLLVGEHAGTRFTKLADFGIARLLEHYGRDSGLTLPQFASVPYAAPEQIHQRETTAASDYYSYGVTLASLITMQIPTTELEGDALDQFLKPLRASFVNEETCRIVEGLVRDLLHTDPQERPRPATITRVLDSLLNRLMGKPKVGLGITNHARNRIEEAGLTLATFIEDLNDYTVAEYQLKEYEGQPRVNVAFYGRSVLAFTTLDRDDPEKLVLVDAKVEQPNIHRKRRESDSVHVCPYEIVAGDDSAYDLLNEFYEHYRADAAARQRYSTKEDLLAAGRFILDQLERDATNLEIEYRQREKQVHDDILTVEVLHAITTDDHGLGVQTSIDSEVVDEWISSLDEKTSIALIVPSTNRMRQLGRLRHYNPYTRELSIELLSQRTIPPQGRLACQNVAQLASNRRQRVAVDRFLSDDTANARLGDLLLTPGQNGLGPVRPRELIQELNPPQAMRDVVERALAAEDFFLVQGPPGTGKTTLIAELVLQILEDEPASRILVTSQANPAVDNALERIRELASQQELELRTLRLTRSRREQGIDEFQDSFSSWVKETQMESTKGVSELLPHMPHEAQEKVREAVNNWHEKMLWADDVRSDYAQSVQVYGVTCLRAPTLWNLLRKVEFDWIIVDEAAKATDTEVMVPLVHGKRFIMVGDQRQLPPYIDTEIEQSMKHHGIEPDEARKSLFEKVFDLLPLANRTTLQVQYRMHRSIGDFVGELFYRDIGGLQTGVKDEDRSIQLDQFKSFEHRVLWMDVSTGSEEREKDGTSYFNRSEALRINRILELFNEELKSKGISYSVGVITPYSAQVDVLTTAIVPHARLWTNLSIEVSTVDAFQGRENDITVYSMVRTKPGSLRFIEDEKRLNVSFSRAKLALLIFGHRQTAMSSTTFGRALKLLPDKNILNGG